MPYKCLQEVMAIVIGGTTIIHMRKVERRELNGVDSVLIIKGMTVKHVHCLDKKWEGPGKKEMRCYKKVIGPNSTPT